MSGSTTSPQNRMYTLSAGELSFGRARHPTFVLAVVASYLFGAMLLSGCAEEVERQWLLDQYDLLMADSRARESLNASFQTIKLKDAASGGERVVADDVSFELPFKAAEVMHVAQADPPGTRYLSTDGAWVVVRGSMRVADYVRQEFSNLLVDAPDDLHVTVDSLVADAQADLAATFADLGQVQLIPRRQLRRMELDDATAWLWLSRRKGRFYLQLEEVQQVAGEEFSAIIWLGTEASKPRAFAEVYWPHERVTTVTTHAETVDESRDMMIEVLQTMQWIE